VKRFGSIQRLRALAALSVALFHACQWSRIDFAVGAAGVDLFFVISGFVLWTAAGERPASPGAFLLARARRVVPLYWFATLAVTALAVWQPAALPVVHPGGWHLLLSLLFVPHDDPLSGPWPMLPAGWTLTYEAFFYLAFALALAAPRDRRLRILSGLLLIASIIGFAYHGWYTLLANPLLLEFLAGVGLARLWARGRLQRAPRRHGWAAIGAGLGLLGLLQVLGVRDDFWRPFLWNPPAVLIVAGALNLEAHGALGQGPVGRAMARIGDASYALYLCQAPVIMVFAWLTPALPGPSRAALAFALALAAGLACHRWVERPLLDLMSGAPKPRRIDDRLKIERQGRGGAGDHGRQVLGQQGRGGEPARAQGAQNEEPGMETVA
jgi:exopolysaccharide production protein ExoZ